MYLEHLSLLSFRNLIEQKIAFDSKLNIIYGDNAQGKTSILEAIHFLSISKSFRTNSEKIAIQFGKDYFDIKGFYKNGRDQAATIRLFYSNRDGKNIFINDNKINKFSELIGFVPTILLSLSDLEITYGVPSFRRKFLDILLSQVSPTYLQSLQHYKRSLLQRNRLFDLIMEKKESKKVLFPWNDQLVKYGSEIILFRMKFIEYANEKIAEYYKTISSREDPIRMEYKSNIMDSVEYQDMDHMKNRFYDLLDQQYQNDLNKGSTSVGPHRDDLHFYLNDNLIKSFGSQGENKTFLIALKLLEGSYLKLKLLNNPLFLMDDIFGELDSSRTGRLMEYLGSMGQTFVTTTLKNKFSHYTLYDSRLIHLKNGMVVN